MMKKVYLDFAANLGEIVEALSREVPELAPLLSVVAGILRPILEHQNERSSGTYIAASGEKIAADQGLQHARFAAALASDDRNLRQRNLGQSPPNRSENVVKLVDYRN